MGEQCNWCGREIEREDGWRVQEIPGARKAAFCRLEHVVPWSMQGPHWEPGALQGEPFGFTLRGDEPSGIADSIDACAQCGDDLGEVRLLLVRHRGEHRIPDAFCSVDHMADWAKSGGRWR